MKIPHLYCDVIYFVRKSCCLGFEVFVIVLIFKKKISTVNLGLLNCYALEYQSLSEAVNPDIKDIPMKL